MAKDSILDPSGQPTGATPATGAGLEPASATQPEPVVVPANEPQTVVSARFGEGERVNVASQWTLMWWKFRKHRLAVLSLWIVAALYLAAVFVELIAPYDPEQQ